jgi:hypothetical protein
MLANSFFGACKALQFLGLAYLNDMEQLGEGQGGLLTELVSDLRDKEMGAAFGWEMK